MGLVTDALRHFADDIWENRGRILTGLSCTGTLATFIFTIRANEKANEQIHMAQAEKGEYLSSWERFIASFSSYILPGTICAATIGTTILCEFVNEDQIAKLSIALAGLSKLHYDRIRAEKEIGVDEQVNAELLEKSNDISSTEEGYELFHLNGHAYNNGFFLARQEDLLRAETALNREYAYEHKANIAYFVKAIDSETLPVEEQDRLLGWSKWHIPRDSICSPPYIDIYYVPNTDLRTGKKWIEIEFGFRPESDYIGY